MDVLQLEKVYVALGNDLQDGFNTLDWTLQKWKSSPISVVILHVTSITHDFVYTPFGKLPASSVSEEKLEVINRYEQEKMDKLLSKYIAFCGKVKAEIMKVEKSDEQVHKVIVDLISRLKITKLVMGITFFKSSSWRSKSSISGSFYIHQHKPDFCEFFIICGGKLVFLKGEKEDAIMEDGQGVLISKKSTFKSWIGKMLMENPNSLGRNGASSKNPDLPNSQSQWENNVQEIERYFEYLLSLNWDEEICEEENDTEPDSQEIAHCTMAVAEKKECIKSKISEARKIIQLKNEEVKVDAERSLKAEWVVRICNMRAEELDANMKDEVMIQVDIKKDLDAEKEQIQEMASDLEENKNRLLSLVELQSELSNKLQLSTLARSRVEAQLEKVVIKRAEMVREIENLRQQRDVLQRRIEFCKDKDAIGSATKFSELSCSYREYSAEDIRLATDDFSESLRLKSKGDWTNVYQARINHTIVAVKMLNSVEGLSEEDFLAKVKFLTSVRHPHLIATVGFCIEPKCTIFEYMHNGSLRHFLFSSHGKKNQALQLRDRIRIAHQVCLGLGFLHSARPRPFVHGHLTTSSVLLDRNLVAKISGLGITQGFDENDVQPDIQAFGLLLLHLLTGRNWDGPAEEAMTMDNAALVQVLDEMAGQWPLDLVQELIGVAMRCLSINHRPDMGLSMVTIIEELEAIRKKADDVVGNGECDGRVNRDVDIEDSSEVPSMFLCPILQEVMKNPHVAADGFSYELQAIEEWLRMGRDASPMTNLRLKHKFLTPNHTLRSLIQEWQDKRSIVVM